MIQFKISYRGGDKGLYNDFSKYLYRKIQESVKSLADSRKYKVREKSVLESSVIKWRRDPLESINLIDYVINCLEIVKIQNEYVIRVKPFIKVRGSLTEVDTLVRLLEYGNEKVKPYPVITRILDHYKQNYQQMVKDFLREEVTR